MKKLFILIGYRAVGKTTIGRLLAEELGLKFLDTDKMVELQAGQTISSIVEETGWEGFRAIERDMLQQVAGMDNVVVSTGGGAVLHDAIWQDIKRNGGVVWLRAESGTIISRLKQDELTLSQRPSLSGNGVFTEIEDILQQRLPLYSAMADFTVDTDKMGVEDAVAVISGWCRDNITRSGEE